MSTNLWLPFWINIVLLACAIPTIIFLPGLVKDHVKIIPSTEYEGARTEESGPLLESQHANPNHYSTAFDSHSTFAESVGQAVRKVLRLMTNRPNVQILLISFFLTALASSDTKLLVQYISKRYEWTFAQAGYMLSAKAIVNFTLLAVIVPQIIKSSMISEAVHGSEIRLNYLGTEISILVSVVGVLCVALAFKFWMLLAGKPSCKFRYYANVDSDQHSSYMLLGQPCQYSPCRSSNHL
jgi:hypothetical protein